MDTLALTTAAARLASSMAGRLGHVSRDGADDMDPVTTTGDVALPAVVLIRYKASDGDISERAVAVHRVWRDGGTLYLQGVCQLRHALRTFRVDRIQRLICLATGEVADDPADWLEHHAFLKIADAADYTPHALRACRDELAVLAFIANADGVLDPDEVEVAVDLVMMSTTQVINRDRAARYVQRLTPTALDLEEACARIGADAARWNNLKNAMRRIVDADRQYPVAEQVAVDQVEALRAQLLCALAA